MNTRKDHLPKLEYTLGELFLRRLRNVLTYYLKGKLIKEDLDSMKEEEENTDKVSSIIENRGNRGITIVRGKDPQRSSYTYDGNTLSDTVTSSNIRFLHRLINIPVLSYIRRH